MGDRKRQKPSAAPEVLPKLCGADIELGNFVLGVDAPAGTCGRAARALLRHIPGVPSRPAGQSRPWNEEALAGSRSAVAYDPQDHDRRFLPANGGCAYIDLDHLELCLPEVLSAYDHVAAWHAMLRIARRAQREANGELPDGQAIQVLVNNSDGLGNSYGSHLDFLITRRCFDNIFSRKLHHLLFLATYLASCVVTTGAGKVGSENGRTWVPFQLSQRADFFETLTGIQTTFNRPIVNSRDECLCGSRWGPAPGSPARHMARLHVIFFDNTLCHVSSLLKVGVTQIVLAMLERERVPRLILDDPVAALTQWSHDPKLQARAALVSGGAYTALEVQEAVLEEAAAFVEAGHADGVVPRARDIIKCWGETLDCLRRRDLAALASRLDWALKLHAIRRAVARRGISWGSFEAKHLDQVYGSLDPHEGLYWAHDRAGLVEKVVPEARIEALTEQPPEDTRAWLRAHLLRRIGAAAVKQVDWHRMQLGAVRSRGGRHRGHCVVTIPMENPLGQTRRECEDALARASGLKDLIASLDGEVEGRSTRHQRQTAGSAGPSQRLLAAPERPWVAGTGSSSPRDGHSNSDLH